MNKLGLTAEERMIDYDRNGTRGVGELRHFDPIVGLLKIYDPINDSIVEFLYDHDNSHWKGTGEQSNWTCEWYYDDTELPAIKQEDKTTGVSTVSRL